MILEMGTRDPFVLLARCAGAEWMERLGRSLSINCLPVAAEDLHDCTRMRSRVA